MLSTLRTSVSVSVSRSVLRRLAPAVSVSRIPSSLSLCPSRPAPSAVRSFTARSASAAASSHAASTDSTSPALPPLPSSFFLSSCGLYVDTSLPPNFTKILIANRGEIACRIIRTCKLLGIRSVAIYSTADRHSKHVAMADEAYCIGEPPAAQSYLLGEKIIEIAKKSGAQAIHPGYGFLSENAGFAELCEKNGVEFIGPPSSAITSMGSKSGSKIIMTNAGVPVVPGYWGENQDAAFLLQEAKKIGFPVMIKAVSGGGGKGMRIVFNESEFAESLESCKREALNSFKDDRVLLERYIVRPRHIEFQVFADKHGNAVHFFERDCSVQRRHQKVLEEAPAPGMSEELREKMGTAAVNAALAVKYVGAGTVEFIFDAATEEYFFMEMNTRLQVEHPVTEMIVRRDLVQLQLHVANGHKLPQELLDARKPRHGKRVGHSSEPYGHAIEARIYAENPANNFLPATGHLVHLSPPETAGLNSAQNCAIRVESGVRQGDSVSIFYDPMIAKLVTWGPNREIAIRRMVSALEDYQIAGPPTNIDFLIRSLNNEKFRHGRVETGFIAQNIKQLIPGKEGVAKENELATRLAVLSTLLRELHGPASCSSDPFASRRHFRINSSEPRTVTCLLEHGIENGEVEKERRDVRVEYVNAAAKTAGATSRAAGHEDFLVRSAGDSAPVSVGGSLTWVDSESARLQAFVNGELTQAKVVFRGEELLIFIAGRLTRFEFPSLATAAAAAARAGGSQKMGCNSPMAGKIVKVSVNKGDRVSKGAPIVVMEAMKMEHVIRAPMDVVVEDVFYKVGDFVEGGKELVKFQSSK